MNQEYLIRNVARESGITKANVESVLDCTYNIIVREMMKGENVKLFSGVMFDSKIIPEHEAVNPATQKAVVIPEKIKCNVKLSETFKNRVNGIA